MDYTQITDADRNAMLATIGAGSVDDLFSAIPQGSRLTAPLDLPPAASELELQREIEALAANTAPAGLGACFMGGGVYDHFIPSFIDQIVSRGEFLTSYTPYQAEALQGSLQAFFEFQTQIARLTGLDISNASLYEGATATAEAALLSLNVTGKRRVLVGATVSPDTRKVLATYLEDLACELVEVPAADGARVSPDDVATHADADTACFIGASPNVFGLVEDWQGQFESLRAASTAGKAPLAVAVFNPIACALLRTPGECGADIATGEGQPLGVPMAFGGPYLGLFAARKDHMRRMPGRLIGQTTDADGRRVFCLTLQTREQHIRGAKATSNICTNQGLLAMRATMYMSAMGPQGAREVAEQCWHKAHYLAQRIDATPGVERAHPDAPFFNEFVVRTSVPAQRVIDAAKDKNMFVGPALDAPSMGAVGSDNELLLAVTEKRTRDEIDALADLFASLA